MPSVLSDKFVRELQQMLRWFKRHGRMLQPKRQKKAAVSRFIVRRAECSETHNKGEEKTWAILVGQGGSESYSGEDVEVFNGIADIGSGINGYIMRINGEWHVLQAECEVTGSSTP